MNDRVWSEVDRYIEDRLLPHDAALEATLAANAAAGLPAIDVSPAQGRFLHLLVRMTGARRVLEIGTLGGYSTICMASALPADGRLVTLEYEPLHAEVARSNLARAGLDQMVELRLGQGVDNLRQLQAEGVAPFDLVFIDADKQSNRDYLEGTFRLSRPGTVIVLDNVVRSGGVVDAGSAEPGITGTRAAFDFFHDHPRLTATALQTVGAKGYDGFALALVD
ncbi:MAG TPA: O-methyltransferase [Devosiaceae bacterium]|jgi:predicted O-methyltransferase YrrM|nr:O-methyltransferase [Devosiaceae bacterium]